MGHSKIFTYFGLLCSLSLCFVNGVDEQKPLIRKVGADRSVYARRSFALPDVVSDVYEVYVGPSEANEDSEREAVAVLQGDSGVKGVVKFIQAHPNEPVIIEGNITGLDPGYHGFHIHEKGDIRNGCTSTGSHFNRYKQPHGAPTDRIRHVGDLGNVLADASGVASFKFSDSVISLSGINSIIGRACLVHKSEDDLGRSSHEDSKTTGNAGGRLACGLIGIA